MDGDEHTVDWSDIVVHRTALEESRLSMGVYIKGMKMPKCCDVCIFSDWSNLHQTACCKILEYEPCFSDFSDEYKIRVSDLCSLVGVSEPHGRLIDETKIEHVYGEVDYLKVNYSGDTSRVEFISGTDAPTVIEAEVKHER